MQKRWAALVLGVWLAASSAGRWEGPALPDDAASGVGEAPRPVVVVTDGLRPGDVDGAFPSGAEEERPFESVWGEVGAKVIPAGRKTAPNGVVFHPVANIDLDMNLWLCRNERIYLFGDMRFWGQQDDNQELIDGPKSSGHAGWRGLFNLSKREVDLNLGAAWNYGGPWEARAFVYSASNLNRGQWLQKPYGFADGSALENRYYLGSEYANLGREGFDASRASFLSVGYYPSKDLISNDGIDFKPGPFARAYLTCDVPWTCAYVYADAQFIGKRSFTPKLLQTDLGMAFTPFQNDRLLEFRLGGEIDADFQGGFGHPNGWPYLGVRLNY